MLTRLASFTVLRRRLVLTLTAVFLALAGGLGGGVADQLSGGGFDDPDSESVRAAAVLDAQFDAGTPDLLLLVEAPQGVDDPAAVQDAERLVARLSAEPGVTQVVSWWTAGRPDALRSTGGDKALVLARLTGTEDVALDRVEQLAPVYAQPTGVLDVRIGGPAQVFSEIGHTIERDLIRERTRAGLAAAAARGRTGGRRPVVTEEKLRREIRKTLVEAAAKREAVRPWSEELGPRALWDWHSPAQHRRVAAEMRLYASELTMLASSTDGRQSQCTSS